MKKQYNRFQKNSGVYTCISCGKKTRDTGNDETSCQLCKKCYVIGSIENHHNDNGHTGSIKDCDDCQKKLFNLLYRNSIREL